MINKEAALRVGVALWLLALLVAVVAVEPKAIRQLDATWLWVAVYGVGLLVTLRHLRAGDYLNPLALFTAAYVFFLALGTTLFGPLRQLDMEREVENLIGIGYLAGLAGMTMTANVWRVRRPRPDVRFGEIPSRSVAALIVLAGVGAAFLLFAFAGGPPLLAPDVNTAREDFYAGLGPLNVLLIGAEIGSLALLYSGIRRGDRRRIRRSHAAMALLSVLLLLTAFRGRLVIYLFEYWGLYFFLRRVRVSPSLLFGGIAIMLAGLIPIGAYRRGNLTPQGVRDETVTTLTHRPMITRLEVLNFPESERTYGLRYLRHFAVLLPGSQRNPNVELKDQLGTGANMPEGHGITPSIVAESHMSFGAIGVPLVLAAFGGMFGFLYRQMRRKPRFGRSALYVTFAIMAIAAVSSGIGVQVLHVLYRWFWIGLIVLLYRLHPLRSTRARGWRRGFSVGRLQGDPATGSATGR